MAAPKNNQFWKQRSKHGRDKLFVTPELLWEAACNYFDWVDKNPLYEIKYEGGRKRQIPKMRPYSISGLCIFLNCNTKYFNDFEDSLKENPNKDFSEVITLIKDTLYTQKFEGAATGFLNANIISRDLGLMDKSSIDHTNDGEKFVSQEAPQIIVQYGTAPPLASSENDIDTKKEV